MKKLKLVLLLLIASSFTRAFDINDDISSAIRNGDAKQLVSYIKGSLDLTIGSQESVYSKTQAEQILRDFFLKNKPKAFEILHKGSSKEGKLYVIGTMVSGSGKTFRTSFYFKHVSDSYIIQELRFGNRVSPSIYIFSCSSPRIFKIYLYCINFNLCG